MIRRRQCGATGNLRWIRSCKLYQRQTRTVFTLCSEERDMIQPLAAPAGHEAPELEVPAILAAGVRHQVVAGPREPQQDGAQQGALLVYQGLYGYLECRRHLCGPQVPLVSASAKPV